ncbi:PRC-barrel domain-containing protein [Roseiarcaceae bacterium H3SJ34-1]|uniref:PRC-barrel domain-containing protein n=1 Tax=Terripilifer ovatus TaxID=3032367 RepID=UPI003AB995CF|nr:PRC-barrel domain-containing protein [Roseiarcaceae bacterium H3SJ34-1]
MKALSGIGAAVILSVLTSQSFAQAPAARPAGAPAATTSPAAPAAMHGMWRSSKMIGVAVYNEKAERLGDINEVLLDANGKVGGYVVGVGGFLGMGEHDILVTPDKLKFSNEPMKTGSAETARPNTTNRPARDAKEVWYPDHATMAATKDSLKALPEFKYSTYN